jgi:hypothetical protein
MGLTIRRLRDAPGPVSGEVTIEAHDDAGRVAHRRHYRNTYTLLAAIAHAQALAGEAPDLTLTHIGLGTGGATLSDAESAAGWTGAPTVDVGTYRQGLASLQVNAASSTTTVVYNAAAVVDYNATLATDLELWIRLLLRGRLDMATSEFRVYTGGGTAAYFRASLATMELANGVAFQDATWRLTRIPIAAFTVGAGAPSWATVTGVGIAVTANASGLATINFDGIRTIEPIVTSSVALTVPNQPSLRALTSLARADRVVTADAFWTMAEAVDQYRVAGLYAGAVLVSILPFAYYKAAGLTLRVTWALTVNGG